MQDDPRAWLLDDEEEPAADKALDEAFDLPDDGDDTPRARRRVGTNLSPEAFFVFSMMLFFVVCLLSLVILVLTGRILPA